jgi:hypothetical protein
MPPAAWWNLPASVAMAGFEAQRVIALRLVKLARGGPEAPKEVHRMIAEKLEASAEAAMTLATGGSAHTVVARYRTIMRANEKRLSRARS